MRRLTLLLVLPLLVACGKAPGDTNEVCVPGWPDDSALEPNSHPEIAYVLHCMDDTVFTHPMEYQARCPPRTNLVSIPLTGVICPNGDRDFYAMYLLPDETVHILVAYPYSDMEPRDVDARVWRWDFPLNDWRTDIAVGMSTNDNEELTVSTATGSSNPQGWYYLEVFGKTDQDINYYSVSFTLNSP